MGSRYEIEVTIRSARNLKNVSWRSGDLRPYAVAWVDSSPKCSTKVDIDHDTDPEWDEKLTIPLPPNTVSLRDAILFIDIVHANAGDGVKPLVGSARLPLSEVVEDAGIGGKIDKTLKLKRPSGRPQGKLDVRVCVKEPPRYYDPYAQQTRDPYGYGPPPPSGYPYGASPYGGPTAAAPAGYPSPYGGPTAAAPAGYPSSYGGPTAAAPAGYSSPYGGQTTATPTGYPYGGTPEGYQYGGAQTGYGQAPASGSGKKSKFGMGTGLAVGAAAGVLGGLALAEGVDYFEDKVADDAAEKVEADDYDDGDY